MPYKGPSSRLAKKKKARPAARKTPLQEISPDSSPISVVGVGASAGGLEAFEQLLAALPPDTGMAFVLVQHLDPTHESILSELLAKATDMPVIEVTEGALVQPNRIYVIPPNADMSISKGVLHLAPLSPERARRMPIDLFLRSLADDQQSRAIGVILSGTASDGTLGLHAIKAMGGITFAQDDGSAKYNAMPRSAVAGGNVDFVLSPALIARELTRIAKNISAFVGDDHDPQDAAMPQPNRDGIEKIYSILKNTRNVDFNFYKPGTIKRRITRRMFLRKIDSVRNYVQLLRNEPQEVEALFNDVLISVTGFFRDREAYEALRKRGFPLMLKNKRPGAPIRIWVTGCSTGEEAYSIAILLLEHLGDKASARDIQVFATDVSEYTVNRARAGIYPESIAMDMSAERLRRFFQRVDSGYQISKAIRDMCVFAKQDITKDPPFSKMDMISCRNVMIYMSAILQQKILPLFHYALNPGGVLFLGTSETVGNFGDLFVPLDKKFKIYAKKSGPQAPHFVFTPQLESEEIPKRREERIPERALDLHKMADQILLNRYAPASVMVNEKLDIVQFIGQTGKFLEPAAGDASLNLLRMVKTGLHLELRLAFQKVRRDGGARKEGIFIEGNGGLENVNFEIIPVKHDGRKERHYLVVFEEVRKVEPPPAKSAGVSREKQEPKTAKGKASKVELDYAHLQEELEATREYLQSIIEEQRTTNEELRSANEEIQSSNEELQSINEEMETAKEELQSTNEELTTVNEELQNRNEELSLLNNDLNNLLSSVSIPIVMLGNDLRIRRFTPMAEKLLNLIASDIGRPITDIKPNLRLRDLKQTISTVVDSLQTHEKEVEDNEGRWYSMRIRPYRTLDNKIDGVVIIFLDHRQKAHSK